MARIFIDGFESGGYENWTPNLVGNQSVSSSSPITGTYSLDFDSGATTMFIERDFGTTYTELYFAFKASLTNLYILTQWRDGSGNVIFSLTRNSTSHYLEARLGAYNGTVQETGTHEILLLGTQYLFEIYYKPLNTNGLFTVKVDGVTDIDITAGDAKDTTNGDQTIRYWRIGGVCANNPAIFGKVDDVVVDTAGWIGDTRIKGLTITGAGTSTQWDASAGANYECVNEMPYSDTDYVYTNTADEIDTYACADVTVSGAVKCLQLHARGRKTGAPTPTKLQLAVRSGGSDYTGSSNDLPSTFGLSVSTIWETNPADSNAWEDADLDAVEIGVKAVTT